MKYKISKKVGLKIARLRKKQKITQEKLAEKIGFHVSSLGRIERAESNPPVPTLEKIARALKIPLSELFSA